MQHKSTELLLRDTSRAVLVPADHPHTAKVGVDARGIGVMTDLDRTPAVTVDHGTQIDEALRLMKEAGVRSAFVIDAGCNVLGLVTAYDIVGDEPLRYLDSLGCTLRTCSRADVRVDDVMEPVDRWLVIDVEDLGAYSVGDVVETFRRTGRTHIPVVERTDEGADRLRGLLSAAEVARATGLDTGGLRPAATFAEIELAVERGALP